MSIALEARVAELEQRVRELSQQLIIEMEAHVIFEGKVLFRLKELEQTAQRKPGPKPKDNNG